MSSNPTSSNFTFYLSSHNEINFSIKILHNWHLLYRLQKDENQSGPWRHLNPECEDRRDAAKYFTRCAKASVGLPLFTIQLILIKYRRRID